MSQPIRENRSTTMKTIVLTPNSSVKSSTTAVTMDGDSSSYFPGCRKDANCNCEMCLASFNATLDLRQTTAIRRGSRNNLSTYNSVSKNPISFDPSLMSTPKSGNSRLMVSPPLHSTARTRFQGEMKKKKRDLGFIIKLLRLILGLSLILGAEFGFPWVVSRVLQPKLSPEIVKNLAGKSKGVQDLNKRMEFLNKELQGYVGEKISNCSSVHSTWQIIQDGMLLNSHCSLYKSVTEEVRIWGWPLQTAGLFTTEFSAKSLTILTGSVTEWSNGEVRYVTRKAIASWKHEKWSSSVLHLDQNTWILEYKRNALIENAKLLSAATEFFKLRMIREVRKMKRGFWLFSAFDKHQNDFTEDSHKIPT